MEILSKIKNIPISYLVYFVITCILLASIIYVYNQYVAPKMNNADTEFSNEDNVGGESDGYAEMTMFHVDWCPHCTKSKPAFDELAQKYNGKVINGHKMKVVSFNCTDEEDPAVKAAIEKYNIEGYPTITLSKNGELVTFDAQPDVETMERFINEVLNN
jgi:thiol-disulfide isomerase/thioredoxin